jgi:hypothetical protein
MRLLTGVFLAFVFVVSAEAAETIQLIGSGVKQSCGSWLEARQQKSRDAVALQQWTIGHLSGVAVYSENLNPLEGLHADAVWYWLDNYCRANPIKSLSKDALPAFIDEHPR